MFSRRPYQKLWQRDHDEYQSSTTLQDFGVSQYDQSADLHLTVVSGIHRHKHVTHRQCLALGCLYVCILATFAVVAVTAVLYANWFIHDAKTEGEGRIKNLISWRREFGALTELSAETYDVNGDGVLDVLTSGSSGPCMSTVRALNGLNGDTLFESELNFDVFALNCNADLNLDGHSDCILAGRFGGFAAIHGQDGTLLWYVDSSVVFPRYGFYFPLLVRDLDGDGVMDIINTHGGDTIYAPNNRNRSTGLLVVVSGRTGEKLMNRITVPDGKETYSSPVLHRLPDGRQMVLFGTGGETIEGSLWGISLDSIQKSVQDYTNQIKDHNYKPLNAFTNPYCTNSSTMATEALRPVHDASVYDIGGTKDVTCVPWGHATHVWTSLQLCVYQIFVSKQKGVMLPVLLVDMNEDTVLDLVVSTFGGRTAVLDGKDVAVVWDKHFPATESYSLPSPVFFNSDNVPDLLVRANFGTWNVYQYSNIAILDGVNGEMLWTMRSTGSVMSSSIVLRAQHPGNDGALFVTLGLSNKGQFHTLRDTEKWKDVCPRDCLDNPLLTCNTITADSHVTRDTGHHGTMLNTSELWAGSDFPNPESDLDGFLHYCNLTKEQLSAHLYFVVPHMISTDEVKPLASFLPYIDVPTHKRDTQHGSTVNMHEQSPQALRCMHILTPTVLPSTPALSDLDGDGEVEVIVATPWASVDGRYPAFAYRVEVFTLRDKAEQVFGSKTVDFGQFLPSNQQPWSKYMGKMGNSMCIG